MKLIRLKEKKDLTYFDKKIIDDLDDRRIFNQNKKMEYKNNALKHYSIGNTLIEILSKSVTKDVTAREEFWNNSSSDLLYGIIALFLEDYIAGKIDRKQITLTSIKKFQNSSLSDKNLKILKKYIETREVGSKSRDKLTSVIFNNENTYKSVTAVFNERMSLFDDINIENITSTSDFEFDELGKNPTVLYCCIPDETKVYYKLVSLIVSAIYRSLVTLSNETKDKKLPRNVFFLLDEFANTPAIDDLETIVTVARSRGMQFQFFIQSFVQLENIYGRGISQTMQDNCGLAYLKTNTQETAEAISKRLGNETIETTSINYSFGSSSGSRGKSLISRNLMTADEIKQLKYKTIIFPVSGYPIFRNTVLYNKFKCYKDGVITRIERPLRRLLDTYYIVEDLKFNNITRCAS